jgi:hypothetical protein
MDCEERGLGEPGGEIMAPEDPLNGCKASLWPWPMAVRLYPESLLGGLVTLGLPS